LHIFTENMFFKKDADAADLPKPKSNRKSIFTGIIVGGAIGSVLSLLFAPDKGKNTRKKLGNFLEKYRKNEETRDSASDPKA